MPIRFRVNGKTDPAWRVNLMPSRDGTFLLYLNGVIRTASEVGVGDRLTIELWFDDEYKHDPLHPMQAWFGDEPRRDSVAGLGWDRLAPSRQREILRYFAGLKSNDAKQRNLQRAMHALAGGKDGSWRGPGTRTTQRMPPEAGIHATLACRPLVACLLKTSLAGRSFRSLPCEPACLGEG